MIYAILGSLGGIVAFLTGIYFVVRAIVSLVHATRDNTNALSKVDASLITLKGQVDEHSLQIAVIKDRMNRGR